MAVKPDPKACDGVVCYAAVDWWYHNRGHSECQIMRRLAQRLPVLWVNSLGMRAPSPGKSDLVALRYLRKLKSTLKGLRRDPSGMWIYSPIFIPKYSSGFAALNGRLVSLQVSFLMRYLGIRSPSVFATIPTSAYAVERGSWIRKVFNRSDDFSTFPEADGPFVRQLEAKMFELADATLYVNTALYSREKEQVREPRFIGHGVDFEHFDRSRAPGLEPEGIRGLPRPIVGFYGGLRDYTVDLDLMIKSAKAIAPGTLVVIGPKAMDISRLLAEPNVAYLGAIPYERLPEYACQFDVGIMPWLDNEWIEGCNPIKFKEYLALGFPVVASYFQEVREFASLVYASKSHDEFLANLARALHERDDALVNKRKAAVREDSWERIADTVAELLHVPARTRASSSGSL